MEHGTRGADEAVDSILHAVAGPRAGEASLGSPGMWKHDPDQWDGVRIKLGDAIEKLTRKH
jgi:hypothetical protein